MNVYKIEIMVIDFDGLGADGVKSTIEETKFPNWCISPEVMSIDTKSVAWSDDHPLNNTITSEAEYKRLFSTLPADLKS